jgi:hypothetical protein
MTLPRDPYDYDLTATRSAIDPFLAGFVDSLSFDKSGIDQLSKSVRNDPGFALGHALLGRQKMVHGDRQAGLRDLARAAALSHSAATEREIATIRLLNIVANNHSSALAEILKHLETWPRDALALSLAIGPFGRFSLSGCKDWCQASLYILEAYQHHWSEDDWWFLASLSFALSEAGQEAKGLKTGERSIELRNTGTAAHSISHAHIILGLQEEGLAFALDWLDGPGHRSDMRHHINWHRAVFEFDLQIGDETHLRELFRSELSASVSDPMPLLTFSDNASFLWRTLLRGITPDPAAVAETLDYMDRHFSFAGFAFVDIHRICIVALSGDQGRKAIMRQTLEQAHVTQRTPTTALLLALCDTFYAFEANRHKYAATRLNSLLSETALLGGSNPQRRIVEDTYQAVRRKLDCSEPKVEKP